MKKNFLVISLSIISILFYLGCKKSNRSQENSSIATLTSVNSRVSTTNTIFKDGMLCFKDQATFDEAYAKLKLEMNTLDTYDTLPDGFDLGHRSQIEFENSFPGFLSVRKRFNNKEKLEYKREAVNGYFHHSTVLDDRINTFLNAKYQVKIGTDILYKKNRRLMFRIKNNDLVALAGLENRENPLLYPNVSTITTGNWDQYWQDDYTVFRATPANNDVDPCDAVNVNFSYVANPLSNFVSFTYTGAASSSRTVKYYFGDGTTYGPVSSSIAGTNHSYTAAGSYNVIVEIFDFTLGCYKSISKTVNIGTCTACFNYSGSGSNISFDASCTQISNPSATVNYTWDFGDGTTGTGKIITHNYTCNGKREVKLTITSTACSPTLTTLVSKQSIDITSYADGCNLYFDTGWQRELTSPNRWIEYRVEQGPGFNWLGQKANRTYIDAKANYQKRNSFGWWIKTKSGDQLNILRVGYVYKDAPNGCSCSNQIDIGGNPYGNKEVDLCTDLDADNPSNTPNKYYYGRYKSISPYYVYFGLGSTTHVTVIVQ